MMQFPNKKTVFSSTLTLSMLFFILVACGGGNGNGSGVATWTPSPPATATCIPNISLSTPEGWGKSRIIVFLFDPRSIEEYFLEFENNDKTQDILYYISRIIPRLMGPGDQVAVFQLGYSFFDSSIVTRIYSYLTPPELFNTPSPKETLTLLPPTIQVN